MLPLENLNGRPDEPADTVPMIGDALKHKFGPGALTVAELQRDLSNGDTRDKWVAIVAYITVRAIHPGRRQ